MNCFSQISHTVCDQLIWTHHRFVMRTMDEPLIFPIHHTLRDKLN